ncbi:WSC domain-containing protein [Bombardia bombarda]|uniref:WSC domain-containing protein n=1 Tax=Bombardia bombarda TaxID=252184 RepID=A0AA40C145_9PEZI|nr:WSC domain-containing protein [Bombardia bombarda]
MAFLRPIAAALAAISLLGRVQAWTPELPPCLEPFQPFVYSGCYADSGSPTTLSFRSSLDQQNMTVETCVSECKGNGYRYAGLEYYGICFCGQTVTGTELDEGQCSYPCTGNSSQTCGGSNIISIYQDPTFLPLDEVDIEDYAPLGCWTDDSTYGRALAYPQDQLDGATLTSAGCLQACRDGGFPFAGTEYGGECWCGVVIGNDTFSAISSDCDIPCNGNSSQTCGGRSRLNLYVANELQSLEPCGYVPPPVSSSTASSTSATTSSTSTEETSTTSETTTTSETSTTSETTTTCKVTHTLPPKCEWKCGNWCSSPLPDWSDVPGCKNGYSSCQLQVAACFKNAGFPASLGCFEFASWCSSVSSYCGGKGACSKNDYTVKTPPKGGSPPTTTVITTVCPYTSTTTSKPATTTTKAPIPTPTNICNQPSNILFGYGPGKPVGGIELPIVTCNDLPADWSYTPFKLYSDSDSKLCKGYPRNSCTNACADACKEQYEDCIDTYAEGCKTKRDASPAGSAVDTSYFEYARTVNKRTFGWTDSYPVAALKCKTQYADCLFENRLNTGAGKCPKYGVL